MLRRANRPISMARIFVTPLLPYLIASLCLASCSYSTNSDPSSLIFLIESSPTNLDRRFATDSQSQRLDGLLFNGLLDRDNQMNFQERPRGILGNAESGHFYFSSSQWRSLP
jgi:ABC-type transport system substrate-binding protein